MNQKIILAILVSLMAIAALSVFATFQQTPKDSDLLFQASTLDSLLRGSYEGKISAHDLLEHGDFGLGAMEYMDGELVCLDATCYQITSDGMAHEISGQDRIAFAAVVFFEPETTLDVQNPQSLTELKAYLDGNIQNKGIFAIKVDGFFDDVTARSISKQDKLYVQLSDVVGNQTISKSYNIRGTLVGFYAPDYLKEINVPEYHFHFIADDKKSGGHILDMNLANGTIQISKLNEFHVIP